MEIEQTKKNIIFIYRRIGIYSDFQFTFRNQREGDGEDGKNPFVYLILYKADDIAYM